MKIILIDNFDSFSYNLVHYLEQLDVEVTVKSNLEIETAEILNYDAVVLSPGPGLPKDAGKLMSVVDLAVKKKIPMLGVCLGMQAIAEYFGDELYNQEEVKHGTAVTIRYRKFAKLFLGLPYEFKVGLYHSWAVRLKENSKLIATSTSKENVLMSLEHPELPIHAVQFHPESILSENGLAILRNFLLAVI